jgi:hypothetical protein
MTRSASSSWSSPLGRHLIAATLACLGAACNATDAAQVQLTVSPPLDRYRRAVDIRAQVTGSPSGLRYKWYTVTGETDPQESDQPSTVFTFPDGITKDRVTVELWRGDRRVARSEIDVALDSAHALISSAPLPKLDIAITEVPPFDPNGGADTRADIAGRISGELSPSYRVVVYARADVWYRQPTPYASVALAPNGTWKTWTHTGSSYAVFVIRRDVGLSPRLDVLPPVGGGGVVARLIVDGVRP